MKLHTNIPKHRRFEVKAKKGRHINEGKRNIGIWRRKKQQQTYAHNVKEGCKVGRNDEIWMGIETKVKEET